MVDQSDDKYNRGHSLFGEGKYQDAMEMATAAVNLNPQNAVAHCLMASCFRELGKLPEALDEYTQSLFLDPKFFYYTQGTSKC